MFAAGLFGILIPIIINRLKLDPAVASGVFVTTVTDTVGFSPFSAWRRCGSPAERATAPRVHEIPR